ncbi:hypothetical protein [Methylobacterium goesingense]|uniref:Glycosyltransferase family 61 protein n=1 Tax=Methylobacterium goesingense TaxID=243690 RepID=A0ABV2LE47_9HYPH|nr:hypothetical protein [Methylobacterium goesingense]GJD74575.1 hypothetical protein CFIICLFH_2809 [Methylobacterium goesingense]
MKIDSQSFFSGAAEPVLIPSDQELEGKYEFNFNADPSKPSWGEVNILQNYSVRTKQNTHIIDYFFKKLRTPNLQDANKKNETAIFLLMISTTNSGHAVSEIISFINFYKGNNLDCQVGVSAVFVDALPYMFQLLQQFLEKDKIMVLEENEEYIFSKIVTRRNTHMNLVSNFNNIPYVRSGNILVFNHLKEMRDMFIDDPSIIINKSEEIFNRNSSFTNNNNIVMLIKTRSEHAMTTPGRAMDVSPNLIERIKLLGIKICSISDFKNVEEYIATIYSAKTLIVSYGSTACTNRFFCNPNAHVILLANLHYKWEYDYPSDAGEFWHTRHSHLFTAEKQTVIIDHNNTIEESDLDRIMRIIGSRM